MKAISLFITPLLCCTLATTTFAAKQKYGDSANASDALFDPSRVIQIEIRLDPKDWRAVRISHPVLEENGAISRTEKGYDYYRGDVVIDGQVVKSVGVRKKGAYGSTASNRPGLKIKFDEYLKDQEFHGLDMLTLNNCLSDPSKAVQSLVYSFMSEAGGPVPRSNLARVVVNGEDLGIYVNVESIRKPFLERSFPKGNGDLYEIVHAADLSTNWMRGIVHKRGQDERLAHVWKLVEVLDRPGPASLKDIGELVDLDAFITFWAAEVLIGCSDGYAANINNYYFYRDAASRKFFFIPWGRDTAFSDPGFLPKTAPKSVKAAGQLCRRLWEVPEIRERYRREMRRLLEEVWNEKAMVSELSRIRSLCQDDRTQNSIGVKERMEIIVRFIEGRRKEVQAELDVPAQDWPFPPWDPPSKRKRPSRPPMLVEGSFSAVISELNATNLVDILGHGSATLQYTRDEKTHTPFSRFGARAIMKYGELELTVVRIVALNAVGDLRWNLAFRIDPYQMAGSPVTLELKKWVVSCALIQGDPDSRTAKYASEIKGTLELTQVSTNLGGTISGKFKINTTAFEEEKKP